MVLLLLLFQCFDFTLKHLKSPKSSAKLLPRIYSNHYNQQTICFLFTLYSCAALYISALLLITWLEMSDQWICLTILRSSYSCSRVIDNQLRPLLGRILIMALLII